MTQAKYDKGPSNSLPRNDESGGRKSVGRSGKTLKYFKHENAESCYVFVNDHFRIIV